MYSNVVIGFVAAIAFSVILTPTVIQIAIRVGAMDFPGGRKVHTKPIPRLGGIAVYLSFFLSLLLVFAFSPSIHSSTWILGNEGISFVAALLVVLLLGIWDDLRSLQPSQKFLIQLFLATVVYAAGFRITTVTHPLQSGTTDLGLFSYPITVMWIVGVTNAINLIDGLDGLAAGVSTIAAVTILAISLLLGDLGSALFAALLAGSLIGFLMYNFNPARIFLGDSGSLFIGFSLAVLSMQAGTRSSTAFAIVIPIMALGLPIMDTLLAMIRRFLRSLLPTEPQTPTLQKLRSLFQPDKGHIHHKLVAGGLSQRDAVLIMYVISLIFGLGAFAVTIVNNTLAAFIVAFIGVAAVIGIRKLKFSEMHVIRNGALLSLYERPFFARDTFTFYLDVLFVFLAASVSFMLTDGPLHLNKNLFATVAILAGPQLVVMWATKLHRRSIPFFGLGDSIAIVKILVAAVGASGATVLLIRYIYPEALSSVSVPMLLLDLYMVLTLIFGARISFRVLKYLFHRDSQIGPKSVIYGANATGMLVMQKLFEARTPTTAPIGFLDDNPELEGKFLNGYPIFGGHWRIPSLVRKSGIEEIMICTENLTGEVDRRIKKMASVHRLKISRPVLIFQDEVPSEQHRESVSVKEEVKAR
jgi:UDP-GlcNAc:undecaprenyl-phosphate/decaprenyl-phosphate GlcNAc-1-phosphate transferase